MSPRDNGCPIHRNYFGDDQRGRSNRWSSGVWGARSFCYERKGLGKYIVTTICVTRETDVLGEVKDTDPFRVRGKFLF